MDTEEGLTMKRFCWLLLISIFVLYGALMTFASQNSLIVPDGTGAAVRAGFNNAIDTLNTVNSGPSAPGTTEAYMLWADTTNNLLKQRNAANSGWITIGALGSANLGLQTALPTGGSGSYLGGDLALHALPAGITYPPVGVPTSLGSGGWGSGSYGVGTSANDLLQLDSSAKLPAVDGSQLTNLPTSAIPPGAIVPFAGSTAPSGWLLCYGQQVSTSTYAALYAAIGTTYGSGAGSFGIPDLRGRAAFGADAMGGSAANRLGSGNTGGITGSATLGASGGQQSHTLTTAEVPSENVNLRTGTGLTGPPGVNDSTTNALLVTASAALPLTNVGTTSGSGGAHNVTPPALVLNFIIKY